MKQQLELRQGQALVMTPQMRQAIRLLQMSSQELNQAVAEEVERNPLLELAGEREAGPGEAEGPVPSSAQSDPAREDAGWWREARGGGGDDDGDTPDRLSAIPETKSLHGHLLEQLGEALADPTDRLIGFHLVGMVDEAGYLGGSVEQAATDLGCATARVEAVLERLRTFDPPGVFARDLSECLTLQLRERNRLDPAMARLVERLDLLARGERQALRKLCSVSDEDLDDMIAEIRALDPKPGLVFGSEIAPLLVPDIVVRPSADAGWDISLNADTLPRLIVNNAYRAHIRASGDRDGETYIAECFQSANWLIRSLHQRSETVLKVATEIVRRQDAFLRRGIQALRPLVLRDIADATDLHESTVSRATSNKYMATHRGTFELKYFFTGAIRGTGGDLHAAETVRQRIRALIDGESGDEALSDDRLVALLRAEGIDIARRTVAKYRDAMGIGSSAARRRAKRLRR